MNALLKSATVIDTSSDYHGETVDLRITNGKITEIDKKLSKNKGEKEITLDHLHISQGWFDSSVSFGEPGYEERETIANGLEVAAMSGFTGIALNPNTKPVLDTSAQIAYVQQMAQGQVTSLYPLGSLTVGAAGKDLAQLYDMQQAGAIGFTDYKHAIKNSNLLKLALQYAQGFNALVHSYPQENDLVGNGIVNEGVVSTQLGLKGMPYLAESVHIARDLHILEYTGGALHIPTISTGASVALIKEAKKKGLNVSCSVAIANLYFSDDVLENFDTNYKVLPPLRTNKDRLALIEGVKDGTIDMVSSNHNPINIELKKVEFDNAASGSIALEATFKALLYLVSDKRAVSLLTAGRKRFLGHDYPIAVGSEANLSLFSTKGSSRFRESDIISTSKNTAFLDAKLKGKVYGVIANNKIKLA